VVARRARRLEEACPQDRCRQVADERALVAAGIHSRRRAADALGVEDPENEFAHWLEEERHVHRLEMQVAPYIDAAGNRATIGAEVEP
jgi:hypothetical protein